MINILLEHISNSKKKKNLSNNKKETNPQQKLAKDFNRQFSKEEYNTKYMKNVQHVGMTVFWKRVTDACEDMLRWEHTTACENVN